MNIDDLEPQARALVAHLGIENAEWAERIAKLKEELQERWLAATYDDKVKEYADVVIVNLINFLKAYDELAEIVAYPDAVILAKIEEVMKR